MRQATIEHTMEELVVQVNAIWKEHLEEHKFQLVFADSLWELLKETKLCTKKVYSQNYLFSTSTSKHTLFLQKMNKNSWVLNTSSAPPSLPSFYKQTFYQGEPLFDFFEVFDAHVRKEKEKAFARRLNTKKKGR